MDFGPQLQILLTTVIAAGLGGVLGLEREISHKPAGLRTNMLVAASAAILVSLASVLMDTYQESQFGGIIQSDPLRIIEAVVVAVGFIGGGLIIQNKDKGRVRNLTTAATVLFAATIGIAVALQQYILAVGITAIVLVVNLALYQFERQLPESVKRKEDK